MKWDPNGLMNETIRRLYCDELFTIDKLATYLGVHSDPVKNRLLEMGISIRRGKGLGRAWNAKGEYNDELLVLRAKGMSWRELSDHFGASSSTVRAHARQLGLPVQAVRHQQFFDLQCLYCAKVFTSTNPKRKYCCRGCSVLATRTKRDSGANSLQKDRVDISTILCHCEQCDAEFYKRSKSTQRYCSHACSAAARRNCISITCEYCSVSFTAPPNQKARYCSVACKNAAQVQLRFAPTSEDTEHIKGLYLTENWSLARIAKSFHCKSKNIRDCLLSMGVQLRVAFELVTKSEKKRVSYRDVLLPPDNPYSAMANHGGFIKEHRLVMAQSLGRCLESWEIVHHKNGDKRDNRLENLELIRRDVEHQAATLAQNEMWKMAKQVDKLRDERDRLKAEIIELRQELKHVI